MNKVYLYRIWTDFPLMGSPEQYTTTAISIAVNWVGYYKYSEMLKHKGGMYILHA